MPPPVWQFWTEFAIKVLGIVATFFAVFVALFGAWLRNLIAPPKLTLTLVSAEGYPYPSNSRDQSGNQIVTDGLWYHVRVENKFRWNPVSDLYVFLLSIEEEDAAGDLKPVWVGNAALTWRHEANPQPKKLGYPAECDLCHILKRPLALHLSPIIPMYVEPKTVFAEKCRIALTLQARSVETNSRSYRFEIFWDGKWSDDKVEMTRHLVVKQAR